MSLLITFEGGEGSGKSTQAGMLYRRLAKFNIPCILTHEPGGTRLGEEITGILKWNKNVKISPLAEVFLFNVSRAELMNEVINPALKEGKVVICDRFTDSTLAYQSYGRGLPLEDVREANDVATSGLKPSLTVLIDSPIALGFERKRKEAPDRFQAEAKEFHERVRQGFLEIASREKERFLVVDGTKSIEAIHELIWEKVSGLLSSHGYELKKE